MKTKITLFLTVILVAGCTTPEKKETGKKITRQEWGASWPFTVDEVYLDCDGFSVTVKANGTTYAVNGRAKDQGMGSDLASIWAVDTSYHDSSIKKDIGSIIDAGLKICEGK